MGLGDCLINGFFFSFLLCFFCMKFHPILEMGIWIPVLRWVLIFEDVGQ